MSFPKFEKSAPLSGEAVDSYDLMVRRARDEEFRPVAARAIVGANDGKPVIWLGRDFEVGFVSGGGAIDSHTGSPLEIAPDNVALSPVGDKLQVYHLPESNPIENPIQTSF